VCKQWLLGKRILIDIFEGPDVNHVQVSGPDENEDELNTLITLTSGFGIRFGSTFGIKF
jgi:hypothetical protein